MKQYPGKVMGDWHSLVEAVQKYPSEKKPRHDLLDTYLSYPLD